ncbi:hypothetical protein Q9S36_38245 [Microbacterium sp. ARD31]|uniref:hypothetical protein n=1 Tax=Microbacterium sp. ARD31 TaxID=2962576 RepID=UPI0028819BD0|nr:hypothetical protein [Microbacterium sp. ARD31]MDT0186042.1 hypothetical protein [Microbacterium sp. ARD31]
MTDTTRTELPVVQSGSSCCSTVPTQAVTSVIVEAAPADQLAASASCCSNMR